MQTDELLDRTQILIDIDNGQASIGAKRNRLIAAAEGRYVVFIDDDDAITEDYLEQIFVGIDEDVDHIGVGMIYTPTHGSPVPVECSMRHEWTFDGTKYLRPPQHTCAIRRSIATQVMFPDISFGEDRAYAEGCKGLVLSEWLTTHPVYIYHYEEKK
jgi:glycosyltransferase involved in cell wall biosynthesis